MTRRALALLTLFALLGAAPVMAQTYDLSWYTVDGGGATFSTGGPYSLGATIGQPDASGPLTGGSYSVTGGFWTADGTSAQADLAIVKTDGQTTVAPGQAVAYTITVSNPGPSGVTGAKVSDQIPLSLFSTSWTCVGASGGQCPVAGAGDIMSFVNLPVGAKVTYTVTGTLSPTATGTLANTATVTPPMGTTDPVPGNNFSTDTDTIVPAAACGVTDTTLVADGRALQDTVPAGGTRWYAASLAPGRSYSIEVTNTAGTSTSPGTLTVFSGDDGCSGTSTQAVRNTSAVEPGGDAATVRASFTAAGSQTSFRARLVNGGGQALPLRVRWAETTLYSAAWSDNGTYDTYYFLQNTTGVTLNATLTLVDTTGAEVTAAVLTIPAGRDVAVNTLALGTPRNKTGIARLAHDGPPGAIVATVAVVNFGSTPAYVQAVKFRTLRESR